MQVQKEVEYYDYVRSCLGFGGPVRWARLALLFSCFYSSSCLVYKHPSVICIVNSIILLQIGATTGLR